MLKKLSTLLLAIMLVVSFTPKAEAKGLFPDCQFVQDAVLSNFQLQIHTYLFQHYAYLAARSGVMFVGENEFGRVGNAVINFCNHNPDADEETLGRMLDTLLPLKPNGNGFTLAPTCKEYIEVRESDGLAVQDQISYWVNTYVATTLGYTYHKSTKSAGGVPYWPDTNYCYQNPSHTVMDSAYPK